MYSSAIQVNDQLHPWQGLVKIIKQLRSKERLQNHDKINLIITSFNSDKKKLLKGRFSMIQLEAFIL